MKTYLCHHPLCRYLLICIFVLLGAISLGINPEAFSLSNQSGAGFTALFTLLKSELSPISLVHVLSLAFFAILLSKQLFVEGRPFCLTAAILSCCFSLFLLTGMSLSSFADFRFLWGSTCQVVIALMVFLGYWIILYACLKWLYAKIDSLSVSPHLSSPWMKTIDQHFLIICISALFLCWLIQMLPFFPGSLPYDGRRQLNMYYGLSTLSSFHPYLSTLLMGTLQTLGEWMFGIGFGCIPYIVLQTTVGILVYSFSCNYLRQKGVPLPLCLLALAFFCFVPSFSLYQQAVMKDGLYASLFAWFVLEYVKQFLGDGGKFGIFRLVISGILVCVMRNNGPYLVLPAMFVLIFLVKIRSKRKWFCIALATTFILNFGLNSVLLRVLSIPSGPKVEALSIPIQQIARYVNAYPQDITREEQAIIDRIISYDSLKNYDPECSDPVKSVYRSASDEEWSAFFQVWFSKLQKHPGTYVTATANHMYGYLDPFYFYTDLSIYPVYIKDMIGEADASRVYSSYLFSDHIRDGVSAYALLWQKIPLLSFLVNPAFYHWILMILLGEILRKRRWKTAWVFLLPILNLLVCFASPVNGYLRYMLPIISTMPLFFLITFHSKQQPKLPS